MTWLTWMTELQGKLYLESIGICSMHKTPNSTCKSCIQMYTCKKCNIMDFHDIKIPTELECTDCAA